MKLSEKIYPPKGVAVYTGTKNKLSIFTEVSESYCKLVGSEKCLIGLSDFETPCTTAQHAQKFYDQDRLVEKKGNSMLCLDVHYYAKGLSATFFRKLPKKQENKIIGTEFCGWRIDNQRDIIGLSLVLSLQLSKHNKAVLGENSLIVQDNIGELSVRETEVVYLASMNFKSKSIASILGLSVKTVEDYLYKAKLKYHFNGSKKLFSEYMVEEENMHHYLPSEFLLHAKILEKLITNKI